MRLIDADELYLPYEDMVSRMSVHFAPTIDAVPVVHAKWIYPNYDDDRFSISNRMKCSECGYECLEDNFNYCPYCGAKMDGD